MSGSRESLATANDRGSYPCTDSPAAAGRGGRRARADAAVRVSGARSACCIDHVHPHSIPPLSMVIAAVTPTISLPRGGAGVVKRSCSGRDRRLNGHIYPYSGCPAVAGRGAGQRGRRRVGASSNAAAARSAPWSRASRGRRWSRGVPHSPIRPSRRPVFLNDPVRYEHVRIARVDGDCA